ncbi:D-cysteine desulfhydrase family protein [Breoghania corrubedonensis]|nr:D-cysteine desulfhydrase family protein [Breoghania corrubedonensis]
MSLPRASLGFFPTPVHPLARLERRLAAQGPRPSLFIKRDDQSGVAIGGNKVRKLEFLIGEALARGCDTVVTAGAQQSNHCRQTAAAAAMSGLECHLVLGGEKPSRVTGNLLLDQLFGAQIHWAGEHRKGEDLPRLVETLEEQGRTPCLVPYGGSSAVGASGFVAAMDELKAQIRAGEIPAPTHILVASSSGGTHAGMVVGAALNDLDTTIHGIAIDKEEHGGGTYADWLVGLTNETAALHDLRKHHARIDVSLDERFLGGGYGVVGDLEREAIALLARTEGILVDPVYTGRVFGALLAMIRAGEFSEDDRVLFWHTGGTPAVFAYAEELAMRPASDT